MVWGLVLDLRMYPDTYDELEKSYHWKLKCRKTVIIDRTPPVPSGEQVSTSA